MDASSRRASTLTLVDSNDILNGRNFDPRNWFDHYRTIVKGQSACLLGTGHLCDILKLLYDDTVSEVVIVHLLNIIEQRIDLLEGSEEILEQIVGTFLNFYMTNEKKVMIKKKILSTSTALFVYHSPMVKEESISSLFDGLVKILLRESNNISTPDDVAISVLSRECLSALYDVFPDSIDPRDPKTGYYILPVEDVKEKLIKSQIRMEDLDVTPEILQHALYDVVQLVKDDSSHTLTPAIFKPFISQFCYSSQLYQVHFLVILLREFLLQLFTDEEERLLLDQLTILSRHSSLLVSHRLFALDFICSLMKDFASAFDPLDFSPSEFDGPDTLEKKLKILIQFPVSRFSDDHFLLQLQPLQTLSLEKDNVRATKSVYRVLSDAVSKRDSMVTRVEGIVICLILASPRQHIRYSLDLMNYWPELAQRVASIMLKKILSSDDAFAKDVMDVEQLFLLMEWSLKRGLVSRAESGKSVEQLFKFLYGKSIENPSLVPLLLACVATAIRSYDFTEEQKELLRNILSFVSREAKNNVTLTSWAQIYSIAITALSGVEDICHVFESEDLSCLRSQGSEDHFLSKKDCPILLCRRPKVGSIGHDDTTTTADILDLYDGYNREQEKEEDDEGKERTDEKFSVEFDVSLSSSFESKQVFALIIEIRSIDQDFCETWETPLLSSRKSRLMKLVFRLKRSQPFDLIFGCEFSDVNGTAYMCKSFHTHHIDFTDILAPIHSVSDVKSFCKEWQQILQHHQQTCLETVIRLKSITDCDTLFDQNPLLTPFCIRDDDRVILAIAVMPKSRILITVKVIEGKVNLHALTDDPDSLVLFRQQLVD